MAGRKRKLLGQQIVEVLAVEYLGQTVAQGRLVHLLLKGLVQVIVIREFQDRRGSDHDLVAVGQRTAGDAHAIAERAVGGPEIVKDHLVIE